MTQMSCPTVLTQETKTPLQQAILHQLVDECLAEKEHSEIPPPLYDPNTLLHTPLHHSTTCDASFLQRLLNTPMLVSVSPGSSDSSPQQQDTTPAAKSPVHV